MCAFCTCTLFGTHSLPRVHTRVSHNRPFTFCAGTWQYLSNEYRRRQNQQGLGKEATRFPYTRYTDPGIGNTTPHVWVQYLNSFQEVCGLRIQHDMFKKGLRMNRYWKLFLCCEPVLSPLRECPKTKRSSTGGSRFIRTRLNRNCMAFIWSNLKAISQSLLCWA